MGRECEDWWDIEAGLKWFNLNDVLQWFIQSISCNKYIIHLKLSWDEESSDGSLWMNRPKVSTKVTHE